jgi:hypothetical protein
MALMACPECQREVSDQAATCIHCGYTLPPTSANRAAPYPPERSRGGMFGHLGDFGYVRTSSQAVGWYLCYLIGTVIISIAISMPVVAIFRPNAGSSGGFELGSMVGNLVALIITISLSIVILIKRGRGGDPQSLGVALAAAVGAVVGGGLLGLIGPAYLSTRSNRAGGSAPLPPPA